MSASFTESIVEQAALRDTPLPKLPSGETRVRDAERLAVVYA